MWPFYFRLNHNAEKRRDTADRCVIYDSNPDAERCARVCVRLFMHRKPFGCVRVLFFSPFFLMYLRRGKWSKLVQFAAILKINAHLFATSHSFHISRSLEQRHKETNTRTRKLAHTRTRATHAGQLSRCSRDAPRNAERASAHAVLITRSSRTAPFRRCGLGGERTHVSRGRAVPARPPACRCFNGSGRGVAGEREARMSARARAFIRTRIHAV